MGGHDSRDGWGRKLAVGLITMDMQERSMTRARDVYWKMLHEGQFVISDSGQVLTLSWQGHSSPSDALATGPFPPTLHPNKLLPLRSHIEINVGRLLVLPLDRDTGLKAWTPQQGRAKTKRKSAASYHKRARSTLRRRLQAKASVKLAGS